MKLLSALLLLMVISMTRSGISQDLQKIDSLKSVLSVQPNSTAKVERILELYSTLIESREFEQAKQYLDTVYTLSVHLNYQQGLAKYYSTKGFLFQKERNFAESLTCYSLSLRNWTSLGDSLQVANACLNIGENKIWLKNLDTAGVFLNRAIRIYKELGEIPGQINVYSKLGLIHRFRGEYPEAINQYETAISLAEEIRDTALVNRNKLSLGIIYKFQENWSKALEIFLETVPFYEEILDHEILVSLNNCIGHIFLDQKDYTESLRYLNSALDASEALGLEMEAAANLSGIGHVYRELGLYDEALQYEFQALQIISSHGKRKDIGWANLEIGYTYSASGHPEEANEYFGTSLDIAEEMNDLDLKSLTLLAMGESKIGLAGSNDSVQSAELYESAKNYLQQSLDLLLGIGNKQNLMNNYMLLFKADSATGNLSSALYNYKKFTFYKNNINNVESEKEIARLQYEFLRQQKEKEITDLTLENEIKSLQVKNQQAALLASNLEAENQKAQILLLHNSEELHKLQLEKTEKDLETKNSAILLNESELASAKQIRELQDREIRKQKMQRNGILFTSGLLLLTGILIIRSIQLRRKLDKQQAISQERERISGDLHDDIGSGLSKIILMLEVLHKEAILAEIKDRTRAISQESLELSKNMSSVIWALNSRYDSLESLVAFIRKYASDYFENSPVGFKMNAPAHFPQVHLSSEQRRNIYYAVKEALHNIVKHANATSAEIGVTCVNQVLSLKVKDNGRGLPANKNEQNGFGNGIVQMRKRMENLGGKFYMENGMGTTLTFVLPVGQNRP